MIVAALVGVGCVLLGFFWGWLWFSRVDLVQHERQRHELVKTRHENASLKKSLRVVTHQRDETMEALRRLRDETSYPKRVG